MSFNPTRRPPVVTLVDLAWAETQKPADWDASGATLDWSQHVREQAEAFEWHFAGQLNSPRAWSEIWRKTWWPKADPRIRHAKSCPKAPLHPFVKSGHPLWGLALESLTARERALAERIGIVQFRPDDPRAAILTGPRKENAA